jgi:peptide deformylase
LFKRKQKTTKQNNQTPQSMTTSTKSHGPCLSAVLYKYKYKYLAMNLLLHLAVSHRTPLVRGFSTLPQVTSRSFSKNTGTGVPPFLSQLLSMKEEVDPGVVEGTDLRIVKYPHPALRNENEEITLEELKESTEIADLAKGMLKVMYAAEGVGLAAPQVAANKRLMVFNPSGDSKRWLEETILVNPKIVEFSDATDVDTEGCLSFPEMDGDVTRSKWIKVQAINLRGKPVKKKYTGWEARIFQHEYDHLDGKVYIDRLTEDGREQVQPRLNELIDEFGDGGKL